MLSVRCLSCLSVNRGYYRALWSNGRIKMKLGMQVGLGPGQIVLDGHAAPLPKGAQPPPNFRVHICCCQMAAWIKMPLGM